ncbi:dynamin family protein [Arthrobacter sp. I2-34]|uniref:Dynamin family protein n=1 Tax=Arthrobacter hankyongi TaxID=2904801 RepID=A0ABS9L704_9MICC|nr:dynamin family protein [Arthrobacter hankyongi]MCG2622363.1 dynamin family protein [Arthrobacter hankyongi]
MVSVDTTVEGQPAGGAAGAVVLLEDVVASLRTLTLPIQLPGTEPVRHDAAAAQAQLQDYVLPRYRSLEAPLLAVVGGSTGAGKSTLVNAIVGHPVTRAGAIRPTTRQPVLLHHPADRAWFEGQRILPGLARIAGTLRERVPADGRMEDLPGAAPVGSEPPVSSLVLLADDTVPQGVAVLDAPDIDSISDANRRLAGQLLAAADLWLFVTSANRYADAAPWALLLEAAGRNITVAVVLDRVPDGVEEEVRSDLAGMLARQGLGSAPLFVVPESALDGRGMLPPPTVAPIRDWLGGIAADSARRAAIARRTLSGVISALAEKAEAAAREVEAQRAAGDRLRADAEGAYADAAERTLAATQDGTLLRGEVLARWQDFVGTGEFFRSLESGIGALRDRIGAFFSGRPAPAVTVEEAIETGLQAVIVDEAAKAAEDADARWRDDPAGRQLLGKEDLSAPSDGFADTAAAAIRAWQSDLLDLIRTEGQNKRFVARLVSFGVNTLGVALMVAVFAATGGLTGVEIGVAGGTAVVGQKVLESVFGEDAVRRLTKTARQDLDRRTKALMQAEAGRFLSRLDVLDPPETAARLHTQSRALAKLAAQTARAGGPEADA